MLLHVEVMHTEDGEESPFAVRDEQEAARQQQEEQAGAPQGEPEPEPSNPSPPAPADFVECPYHCGEQVLTDELQFHTDFHIAEDMANQDATVIDIANNFSTDISNAIRNHDQLVSEWQAPVKDKEKEKRWTSSIREMFATPRFKMTSSVITRVKGNEVRRLSKAELGPYANEKRMPAWLIRLLEDGAQVTVSNKIGRDGKLVKVEIISNETPNLVPILARLSKLDPNVSRAFYCDPAVRHVAKLPREGGFCGYRNIQMLISYIRDAKAPGYEHFDKKRLPSILKLQDMIENAWDRGFNAAGRKETGGIRMTRKYIGTPEAQALLLSLDIEAEAQALFAKDKVEAYRNLMEVVWSHFESGVEHDNTDKIVMTDKPPLFFQHRGHSLTIVGIETDNEERPNLVVFDPTYNPSKQLRRLALNNKLTFGSTTPEKFMKVYRRDELYLGRYREFELIKVNGPG